ncbi:MAG: hypothetical protein ACJAVN_002367 [Roseivirga sp.]|jgi:hypothetical protein
MNLRVPVIKTNTQAYIIFEMGLEYTSNDFRNKTLKKSYFLVSIQKRCSLPH